MGCSPSVIHHEKDEFLRDDILFDDLELSDETSANFVNDSIRVNESIQNRKILYKEENVDFSLVQEQLLDQKPFIIKSCFKKNNKTKQFMQNEKKVRFCKTYFIIINGVKFVVKRIKQRNSKKRNKLPEVK
ncbi:unnamed protein product (macronuclear) [Paramecium tetraurelia]|uniref:Uncharacterized protein n=1 Tax=Paramecium tetraurelia TaxID=5888 RepID=A0CU50_PARTE|nr:uncharacterized protein GSPATT00010516001 [Paramecium tetraurelia]CAK74317.1 unnamed protein product [Paramecium tetraurelia]|eukprot:XP_001441714.1 hypothetical protein (macronuclear) [Paramecium tetraurelia strain d4-2]